MVVGRKSPDDNEAADYCQFPHLLDGERRITDFDHVVEVINEEVDLRAGTNKGIIMEELFMKIFSPKVINLTVVDLPGMVKNPTGDQPEDIETQVEELIRSYIANKNSIILAVSAATNDIANSGSLKLAKEVDPQMDRTVAVITKLDLMDHGTNATDVLTGKIFPVKLGIVGVVNRSYEDIQNNKTISDSIEYEAKFLKDNYFKIASRNGSPYLKAKLQALLLKRIHKFLPELKDRFSSLKNEAMDEIAVLGGDTPLDMSDYNQSPLTNFAFTPEPMDYVNKSVKLVHFQNQHQTPYLLPATANSIQVSPYNSAPTSPINDGSDSDSAFDFHFENNEDIITNDDIFTIPDEGSLQNVRTFTRAEMEIRRTFNVKNKYGGEIIVEALIDTGATISTISPRTLVRLELQKRVQPCAPIRAILSINDGKEHIIKKFVYLIIYIEEFHKWIKWGFFVMDKANDHLVFGMDLLRENHAYVMCHEGILTFMPRMKETHHHELEKADKVLDTIRDASFSRFDEMYAAAAQYVASVCPAETAPPPASPAAADSSADGDEAAADDDGQRPPSVEPVTLKPRRTAKVKPAKTLPKSARKPKGPPPPKKPRRGSGKQP